MICILQNSDRWTKNYHKLKIATRAGKIPKNKKGTKDALHPKQRRGGRGGGVGFKPIIRGLCSYFSQTAYCFFLHCFSGLLGVLVFWISFFFVLGYLGNPELAITSNFALIYAEFSMYLPSPLVILDSLGQGHLIHCGSCLSLSKSLGFEEPSPLYYNPGTWP